MIHPSATAIVRAQADRLMEMVERRRAFLRAWENWSAHATPEEIEQERVNTGSIMLYRAAPK